MNKLYSSSPNYLPQYTHQTELSDITDEEFNFAWKPRKYSWYQQLYQIICFFIFLGPIRILIGVTIFIISMTIIVLIRIFIRILGISIQKGKRFCISIANFGFRFLFFAFGIVYIKVNGKIDPETRVIISNHTAYVDPMIVSCVHHVTAVMKKELSRNAYLRLLMEVVDPVYVDRSVHTGASQLIIEHANDLKKNPVLIFPEATLNNGDHMLRFHHGAFLTKQKVQPICIRYWQPLVPHGWNQFAWTENNLLKYLFQIASMPFTFASVDILEPITLENEGKGDVDLFTTYAQLLMANHIGVKAISRSSDEIFAHRKKNDKQSN